MWNCFVILYLSVVVFDLWLSILYMGNLMGLFFMLEGGFGCWGCCGCVGYNGVSGILGSNSLLFDIYFTCSVRACGCLLHWFGQF